MGPDLVVFGNLLLDDVVFPDGHTRMAQPGGAVLYLGLGASLWGPRVGIASRIGDDYPGSTLGQLTLRHVDLEGVSRLQGPSLRTWLLYEGRRRRVVHRLDGPTHAEVSPEPGQLPEAWRSQARAFHLAPMPFDSQQSLLGALEGRGSALLSLDPYVLLAPDTLDRHRELVRRVDVFLVSEDEIEIPGALEAPQPLLRSLAAGRLRYLLLKRGARGGLLYDVLGGRFVEWAPAPARVVDPTGAGDAFAGGFLAGLLRGEAAEAALRRGATAAAFAIEDWGADGLMAATPSLAETRLASLAAP